MFNVQLRGSKAAWWKFLMPPTYKNEKFEFSYFVRLEPKYASLFGESVMSDPIEIEFVQMAAKEGSGLNRFKDFEQIDLEQDQFDQLLVFPAQEESKENKDWQLIMNSDYEETKEDVKPKTKKQEDEFEILMADAAEGKFSETYDVAEELI